VFCACNTPNTNNVQSIECVTIGYMFVIDSADIFWELHSEELEALLEGPEIQGMWHNALDKMRDAANELAQTEGAEYGSAVHQENNPWGFDPGGYIYTKNYKARVDDQYHHTLLEVWAMAPALIEEAGRMDLGGGKTFDPAGRGSKVRGADGRFTAGDGIKSGKAQASKNKAKR